MYLSCLDERLLDIEITYKKYNLNKEECDASYSLNDYPSYIIKGTDKGSIQAQILDIT